MKSTAIAILLAVLASDVVGQDTLPPLANGMAPRNLEELWAGYDPTKEPLDVQVVHQWQRDYAGHRLTVQMLVYTVGTFKGVKSRMGAYYAFPNERTGKVPAILQMHGGGQRAMRATVEASAANGYACIAINWGGQPMEDQQPDNPGTDWGAVDATQTTHNSHYGALTPDEKTLDPVVSPRNSNWFLIVVAARRALTFLEQRPEVDATRLGVEGHSMGGKLTVMTAGIDPRVRAAAPSCGGTAAAPKSLRDRPGSSCRPVNSEPLYYQTIDDLNSIRRITCPILYCGPQNDFNGNYDNLNANWREMPSESIHFSISPHLNHRHIPEAAFAAPHFFDVVLKGEGIFPKSPELHVTLKTLDGVPVAALNPDQPDQVVRADIYYSINPHALTRFWRTAPAERNGDVWTARCPVFTTDMPLFVMANVHYPLPKELIGPPWNKQSPKTFLVSSWEQAFDPPELKTAGVKETDTVDRMIEASFDTWQDWYRLEAGNPDHTQCITRKITDPKWRGPDGAKLAIDVLEPAGGEFALTVDVNRWNAYEGVRQGSYYAAKPLAESPDWQTVEIGLDDFKPLDDRSPDVLPSWQYLTELGIVAKVRAGQAGQQQVLAGSRWTSQRKLRNLRWVGGEYPDRII
ncbi:MAG: acetylxylan esterase, partial [Planctomycetes bacterium]|nr:acetylxylan esterase [Planctomycetota bacterium]